MPNPPIDFDLLQQQFLKIKKYYYDDLQAMRPMGKAVQLRRQDLKMRINSLEQQISVLAKEDEQQRKELEQKLEKNKQELVKISPELVMRESRLKDLQTFCKKLSSLYNSRLASRKILGFIILANPSKESRELVKAFDEYAGLIEPTLKDAKKVFDLMGAHFDLGRAGKVDRMFDVFSEQLPKEARAVKRSQYAQEHVTYKVSLETTLIASKEKLFPKLPKPLELRWGDLKAKLMDQNLEYGYIKALATTTHGYEVDKAARTGGYASVRDSYGYNWDLRESQLVAGFAATQSKVLTVIRPDTTDDTLIYIDKGTLGLDDQDMRLLYSINFDNLFSDGRYTKQLPLKNIIEVLDGIYAFSHLSLIEPERVEKMLNFYKNGYAELR